MRGAEISEILNTSLPYKAAPQCLYTHVEGGEFFWWHNELGVGGGSILKMQMLGVWSNACRSCMGKFGHDPWVWLLGRSQMMPVKAISCLQVSEAGSHREGPVILEASR